MYDQVETIAASLGIKPSRAPRLSQVWECWADRVLEAEMHARNARNATRRDFRVMARERRDAMIVAANSYA